MLKSLKLTRLGGERESVTSQIFVVTKICSRPRLALFSVEKSMLRLSNPHAKHVDALLSHLAHFVHCGERGIRTPGTISDTQSFQDCRLNRSRISPKFLRTHAIIYCCAKEYNYIFRRSFLGICKIDYCHFSFGGHLLVLVQCLCVFDLFFIRKNSNGHKKYCACWICCRYGCY